MIIKADSSTDNLFPFEPKKLFENGYSVWKNPKLQQTFTEDLEILKGKFIGIKTVQELANILEIPVGQLIYIIYTNPKKYNTFIVKKKSGKDRIIESPSFSIKILQNKVRPLIESHYRVKKPVHGFVGNGKGIISNAEQHKKKNYVLNVDLQDFFHSINFGRVRGIFRSTPFNMGDSAATVLAQLCTYNGRLPQGACTSPILSNLAATSLDKKLLLIARKFHLTYTRYADDLTFSSNKPFPEIVVSKETQSDGLLKFKAGSLLEQTIRESGFSINHNKTRLQSRSQRQEVTGLVVNDGVNIKRQFIRKTRAMINEWRKDLLSAERRFIKMRYHVSDSELENRKLNGSVFKNAIYGNLSFIKMVKGEDHSPYLSLCKQVLSLDTSPPDFISKLKGFFDMYDVFICHASEDKELVAIPLHQELKNRNIETFIDCFNIHWGDSLVSKINTALQKSKYVIAIVSEDSVAKSWPMKELNAVLSAEIGANDTKLLPLMVGDGDTLIKHIPLLGDKVFVSFNNNITEIVDKVENLLKKNK